MKSKPLKLLHLKKKWWKTEIKRIEKTRKAAWHMAIRRKGWTGLHEVQSLSKQTKKGPQPEVFIQQSGTQQWWTDSTSCPSLHSSWDPLIFIRKIVLLATALGWVLGVPRESGVTSVLAVAIVLWCFLIAVPMGSSDCQLYLLTAHIRRSCSSSTLLGFQDHVCLVLWRGSLWHLL